MRLTFLGAAGMVTGSCYLLEAGGLRLLVDCGLFQGQEEEALNRKPFDFNPAHLDAVILTHAHIDHSGRLPLLPKQGFTGPMYTHLATIDLVRIMLMDSAYIHESEAERQNRKSKRAGLKLVEPLYTQEDARTVMDHFRPVPYGEFKELSDTLKVRLHDAGHILGSAIVEFVELDSDGKETRLVFSGDLGQPGRPILQDPTIIREADYLVLESTYGDRNHEPPQSTRQALAEVIRSTIGKGGNLVIPAFAVGRTQELLYELNGLASAGQLPQNLRFVLDSPLAIAATEITANHHTLFDEAAQTYVKNGDHPFSFPGLVMSNTADESRALNLSKQPSVIIAASGMCEAGRVVHHLKHNLWRPVSTVLFVGYQAEGTLGRRILDGAKRVRVLGEEVAVRARVESLQGLSAHADQTQLLDWVDAMEHPPRQTFLVHGEDEARETLSRLLKLRGHQPEMPLLGETVELGMPLPQAAKRRRLRPAAPEQPTRVALASGQALANSSRKMAALLKELRALRKAWNVNGPHLPPGQAEELAEQADEALLTLEALRRLIEGASEE